ncbi:MAG: hypothetical protein ACLQNE_11010 [Thermoguttaceae bacterium]
MLYFCQERIWVVLISCVCCAMLGFVSGCDNGPSSPKPQDRRDPKERSRADASQDRSRADPGRNGPSSSRPQDLIVGKWTWAGPLQGNEITIMNDFTRDGVVKVVQGGIPFEAKYRFVDDTHIEYDLGMSKQHSKIESITKDKLVVIDEQGLKREWTRP